MSTKLTKQGRLRAGHYEILGETYAQFEFFENGWFPYRRFLDIEKIDFILRRTQNGEIIYREVQVKYGKLYDVGQKWEKELFDYTSWRFFNEEEFSKFVENKNLFLCYILAPDTGYEKDLFIFPIKDFNELLKSAYGKPGKKTFLLSRSKENKSKWYLRRKSKFTALHESNVLDVSHYFRNFELLSK